MKHKEFPRERFVPPLYRREIKQKLQKIRQGYRIVDEHLKETESLMQRADIQEDEEDTMTRFVVGLNDNILEVIELKPTTLFKRHSNSQCQSKSASKIYNNIDR
ncbi:hypothetical protein HRI_004743600 [Hibiscus trionum]|uniref:Retrotransposon gag domain-containing protein n=1 Tax=Hibiscus trionum TaxID=183268 RepID=A0A9W7JC72_HIBTR|nr:hypothetical protein HRI_004743600 [Hibiscus trionum]